MKVNKKYFLSTFGLLTFSLPILLVSLTSCDQVWAYSTPIICGTNYENDERDPFFNFRDNEQLLDKDTQPLTYLPKNYISLKNNDGKSNSFYGYTTPIKSWIEKENEDTASKKSWKDYQTAQESWCQTTNDQNSSIFPIQYQKSSGQVLFNYHNYEITKSISLVNNIAQSLNFMIDNAFAYQQSFLSKSDQNNDEKIANAWGCTNLNFKFNHGNKNSQENADFYEFLFANSNFHVVGKSNAFLKTVAMNFNFDKDYFPVATYENNKLTNTFKKLLEGKEFATFKETEPTNHYWSSKDGPITIEKFWSNNSQEAKKVVKQTYHYQNVPIIINPVSLVKTYLNPTCNSSFLVGDYYQNNADTIKNAIGNSWKNAGINNFVGTKLTGPTHKSFNIKISNTNPIKLKFKNKDNRLPNEINANSFIGLLNCNVDEYFSETNEVVEQACDISLINIFPSYFLQDYEDLLTNAAVHNVYTIDSKALNKHLEDMVKLHSRKSDDGQQIDPKNVKDKSLLSFLGYLFAQDNNTIQTNSFIQPFEKI